MAWGEFALPKSSTSNFITSDASDLFVPITPDGPRFAQPTTYIFSLTRPSLFITLPRSYGIPGMLAAS